MTSRISALQLGGTVTDVALYEFDHVNAGNVLLLGEGDLKAGHKVIYKSKETGESPYTFEYDNPKKAVAAIVICTPEEAVPSLKSGGIGEPLIEIKVTCQQRAGGSSLFLVFGK